MKRRVRRVSYSLTPRPWWRGPRLDLPPPTDEEKRAPMRWRLDPASPAAEALRALKEYLKAS